MYAFICLLMHNDKRLTSYKSYTFQIPRPTFLLLEIKKPGLLGSPLCFPQCGGGHEIKLAGFGGSLA